MVSWGQGQGTGSRGKEWVFGEETLHLSSYCNPQVSFLHVMFFVLSLN